MRRVDLNIYLSPLAAAIILQDLKGACVHNLTFSALIAMGLNWPEMVPTNQNKVPNIPFM